MADYQYEIHAPPRPLSSEPAMAQLATPHLRSDVFWIPRLGVARVRPRYDQLEETTPHAGCEEAVDIENEGRYHLPAEGQAEAGRDSLLAGGRDWRWERGR